MKRPWVTKRNKDKDAEIDGWEIMKKYQETCWILINLVCEAIQQSDKKFEFWIKDQFHFECII